MSMSRKSLTGNRTPIMSQTPAPSARRAEQKSPLTVRNGRVGPGMSWVNLTRQDVEKMGWEQLQAKAQRPGKLQRMAIMEPIRNHTGNHGSYVCPSYFDRADRRSVRIRLDTAPLRLL